MKYRAVRGFTLVEVLVALAIVALALAAGMYASGTLISGAERQRNYFLAQMCAENAFTEMRLQGLNGNMPAVGKQSLECKQAGEIFTVSMETSSTLNPNMLRLDATVLDEAGNRLLLLSSVLGR